MLDAFACAYVRSLLTRLDYLNGPTLLSGEGRGAQLAEPLTPRPLYSAYLLLTLLISLV